MQTRPLLLVCCLGVACQSRRDNAHLLSAHSSEKFLKAVLGAWKEAGQCRCEGYNPAGRSVAVLDTLGDLGNKMLILVQAELLERVYGVRVLLPAATLARLARYFPAVAARPAADRVLCGFPRVWREFRARQLAGIAQAARH